MTNKRPAFATPRQMSEWCDRELSALATQARTASIAETTDQYRRAQQAGDWDRADYWFAVRERVQMGADLNQAMTREAERRDTPLTTTWTRYGEQTVLDLDWWRC